MSTLLLLSLHKPNRNGEAAYIVIGFCVILLWWRWGESNPRPKNVCQEFLRAQSLFYISLTVSPNDRLYSSAAPNV